MAYTFPAVLLMTCADRPRPNYSTRIEQLQSPSPALKEEVKVNLSGPVL